MDPSLPVQGDAALHQMELHPPVTENPPSSSSALWEWGDFLDFAVDDSFPLTFDEDDIIAPPPPQPESSDSIPPPPPILDQIQIQIQEPPTTTATTTTDRIRKRDPRLICSNFLAGRVPCACPEMDAKLAEEEAAMPGKKRVRVARSGTNPARCQVPGCEADITQLKGYHRRHRVCLGCANASAVLLDGETKRYCQQCGKFHVLSDFDKGKRSCRRKLERHNNRRRRKPQDGTKVNGDLVSEDTNCDDGGNGTGKDGSVFEKEVLVESEDGHFSAHNSDDPTSQNVNSDSGVSFGASGDTQTDGGKDDSKFSCSPSNFDNKTAYSSVCPTGRISFKLYDWNPAEFPRRLRHQIFQWLASMPVELEGYIRPGCTILTAFIAMPSFMWEKLFEDPLSYLHDILDRGKILSKKGPMLVYLNNMVFHVIKDGTSMRKVSLKGETPRLHYVHPSCFEAGKSMELVVCGSNLSQPKFRFLVSFAGKYMSYDHCIELPRLLTEGDSVLDHQLYQISIPRLEPKLCGPAFIEVENESGLSNFIPVIIGDRQICSEMEMIRHRFDASNSSSGSECEVYTLKQMAFSDLLVDIAWLLKEPLPENVQQIMTSSQIQRFNTLLKFLLQHEPVAILDKILRTLKIIMDKLEVYRVVNSTSDDDVRLLQKYMDYASDVVHRNCKAESSVLHPQFLYESKSICGSCCTRETPLVTSTSEDLEERPEGKLESAACSTSIVGSEETPLLKREVVMNMNLIKERPSKSPSKSCGLIVSKRVMKSRPTVFVVALLTICFGVCAFFLHPQKVSKLAVTIRRCLTDGI
ncbi:hypothetical protein Tsubulata_049435 [Turnera subulata]|uniref:SBP-type domain-containing protein n=1 Tax=Turnera subulata TaxID=218843 RepID=A0A9Q0FRH9_9ROSI|nr:hypothetical protein Tsubulata_049435 [Turnera subulata]